VPGIIAAGVADPGVVDVLTTVLGHLPHMMIKLLEAGEREKFNRDMEWALKISPSTRPMLALRMRPYGVTTPCEFFSASRCGGRSRLRGGANIRSALGVLTLVPGRCALSVTGACPP
jgi:hypothetical protein